MKQHEAEELLSLLPQGRTLFTYGKDWYAVTLLQLGLRHHCLQELRQNNLGKLFEKPALRSWLGSFGKKTVTPEDLALIWPDESETYRLTAGLFSGWQQTSRKGPQKWNIVLQLNLNESDARFMERKLPDRTDDPFEWRCHPIHEGRHRTLAWARIDLDWNTGEALIEEIQNDRLREVKEEVERIRLKNLRTVNVYGTKIDAAFIIRYWEQRLRLSRRWWDEAMLCAAIRFIVEELGIRTVWYHSAESGKRLKGVRNAPTSLYSDLPRRFCFEKTESVPAFLKPRRSLLPGLWMHRLHL